MTTTAMVDQPESKEIKPEIYLDLEKTTPYNCPYCQTNKLTPLIKDNPTDINHKYFDNSIHGHSSEHKYEIAKLGSNIEFSEEFHFLTAAKKLECTDPSCKCVTIVVGRLFTYSIDGMDNNGQPYRDWFRKFTPKFFYPCVDIFPLPDYIPEEVCKEIRRSYGVYFQDPNAAANSLRAAVECFLDNQGYLETEFVPLQERLNKYLAVNPFYKDSVESLTAIKWLGNEGSHYQKVLTHKDMDDGYKIFLDAMELILSTDSATLIKKRNSIIERNKRPKKTK